MKNNLYIGIIIASVFIQKAFIFFRATSLEYKENFLLSGIPYYDNLVIHNLHLMLWIFPIIIILFMFNGEAQQLYHGYGILKIIRGELRYIVIIKKEASICIRCFCILFLYVMAMQDSVNFSKTFFQSFLMFYLTFIAVLLFQFVLEHIFMDKIIAFTVILVWFVISIMLSNVFKQYANYEIWQYVFIPNFAFTQRNGMIQVQGTANGYLEIGLLGVIIILETICSIIIGRKKDLI